MTRPRLAWLLSLLWGCASPALTPPLDPPRSAPLSRPSVSRSRPAPLRPAEQPEATPPDAPAALPASAPAPLALVPHPSQAPRSTALASGFFNPMPGGLLSGYRADTGLDIAGFKMPVHAIASGTLDYAERGHTRWVSKNDSPFTVRLRLDQPVRFRERTITHVYYGHLSSLELEVDEKSTPKIHVEAGQQLGVSGWANGSPHLHLGLLLDGHVDQESWSFLLDESEVREALGVGPNGKRLPRRLFAVAKIGHERGRRGRDRWHRGRGGRRARLPGPPVRSDARRA